MIVEMKDKFYFPETERAYTDEGYLIVPATISRPGTQLYKAIELVPNELSLPKQFKPNDPIVVYRPPEEVFKQESIDSFKNIAVTNNHPPEFLNSKNYRKYSVGIVLSDVNPTDTHIAGTIKVTDYDTINEINNGKVDISAGYHSNVFFEDGETPSGEKYQAIQKDIRGNHVAVVLRGRAGSEVKIADSLENPSERSENLSAEGIKEGSGAESSESLSKGKHRKPSDDELDALEFGADGVPGSNTSTPFGDEKEILESTGVEDENIKDVKELTMKLEDAMTKINELTETNSKLSSQILDQAGLDTLVEDRMQLIDVCSILVNDISCKGKSNSELKKEVLLSKMEGISIEDKSSEYIDAAFDVMKSSIKDSVEGKHDEDTYGKDLSLEDSGDLEKPKGTDGDTAPAKVTKNVHEGENPDEHGAEAEQDEEKAEVKDSVSILDSAFGSEIKQTNIKKEKTPYEKHCERSRNSWKQPK